MSILYYRIKVEDNSNGEYDLETILEIGLDECGIHPSIFRVRAVEVEDAE